MDTRWDGHDEAFLTPPTIDDDTRPPEESPEAFVTALSAQERPFEARGAVRVKIGTKVLLLAIQSVPSDLHTQEHEKLRPKMRRMQNDMGRFVFDETTPAYQAWQIQGMYVRILLGLVTMTLTDRQGRIVWDTATNVRDMAGAIQALKDAGLTDQQLLDLLQAINGLTRQDQMTAQQDQDDFL